MRFILKKYLLTVASVFILTQSIPAFSIAGGWQNIFFASLLLALLLYVVKPIINLIMLPVNLVTLNLSSWLVYVAIFYLWTVLIGQIKIVSWQFPGIALGPITLSSVNLIKWQVTIVLGVVFIFVNKLLDWIFK